VVSFTPRPLYLRGKSPWYPLDRRSGGPQSRSGRRGEVKILATPGLELRPLRPPARSQSLYRLSYEDQCGTRPCDRHFNQNCRYSVFGSVEIEGVGSSGSASSLYSGGARLEHRLYLRSGHTMALFLILYNPQSIIVTLFCVITASLNDRQINK
jgi:hypothetical protein